MLKNKGELVGTLIGLTIIAAILTQIWTYVVGGLALLGACCAFQRWHPPGPPNRRN
jgi:hypothetical protein